VTFQKRQDEIAENVDAHVLRLATIANDDTTVAKDNRVVPRGRDVDIIAAVRKRDRDKNGGNDANSLTELNAYQDNCKAHLHDLQINYAK